MIGFLAEIGNRLADRWVAMLAVPGLLYLAATTTAFELGQGHALSYGSMSRQITAWAASPALKTVGGTALIIAAVLAGAALAGLSAAVLGSLVEVLWTLPGRRFPARWVATWRRKRSVNAKATADNPRASEARVRNAMATADRICLIEAANPPWIGDRLR